MPIVADAAVAIRGDLSAFSKDLGSAKASTQSLGVELRKALSFGSLAAQGPQALVAGLERAKVEADDVTAAIRKLADSGKLPAEDARRYADLLDEIGIEADQTTAELRQLASADPRFNTPNIQNAAREIDRVGDEAKGTAAELNAMKGVRADTHLERLAQQARKASGELDKTGDKAKGLMGKLQSVRGLLAGLGLFIGTQQILSFFGDATEAASNLNETISKTGVILGTDSLPELERWAEGADTAFGQSKQQALDAASTFAIFGKSAGLAGQELATFSTDLTELSGDLASFFNTSPEDAITAIGAALRGESEPIRRYGVLLDEATLRQRALKLGIIETTTQALTPQQRVLAAQAEILAQTSDAQGDFARTSTGLANVQRINAAKVENAMADLGKALIPVVTGFSNLQGEVIPKLVAAIKAVLVVLVPLGGLLADHAEIVPILAIALGVGLVRSLNLAAIRMKVAGVAAKGMLGPLALLLIATEALQEVTGLSDDFLRSLRVGKERMEDFQKIAELTGSDIAASGIEDALNDWGVAVEDFARLVDLHGGDVEAALKDLADSAGDVDTAINDMVSHTISSIGGEWTPAMRAAFAGVGQVVEETAATVATLAPSMAARVEEAMAKMREVPGGFATTLDNGTTVFGASADALAQLLPAAIKRADEDAQEAAREIPGNIAQSILEGRDAVLLAAEALADAAVDPLLQAERIAEIREQMKDLANVTAEELEAATPTTIAADKRKYAELEIQLAGHLLRADPLSKEAAGLLAKYLESEDPAVQTAMAALADAVGVRLETLELDAEQHAVDTATALPEALDDARADAVRAQIDTTRAVLEVAAAAAAPMKQSGTQAGTSFGDGIAGTRAAVRTKVGGFAEYATTEIRTYNLSAAGKRVGMSWGDGLWASRDYVRQKAALMAQYGTRDLVGLSPPKTGPLQQIDKWGFNIGQAWSEGLSAAIGASGVLDLLRGNFPRPTLPAWAGVSPGAEPLAVAGAAGGTTIINNNNLNIEGEKPVVSTAQEIAEQAARLGRFKG